MDECMTEVLCVLQAMPVMMRRHTPACSSMLLMGMTGSSVMCRPAAMPRLRRAHLRQLLGQLLHQLPQLLLLHLQVLQ